MVEVYCYGDRCSARESSCGGDQRAGGVSDGPGKEEDHCRRAFFLCCADCGDDAFEIVYADGGDAVGGGGGGGGCEEGESAIG